MANILDLDPFAFDAALQELGIPEEEQARLREQYRQKNSTFSGVKDALAPQEGRNTSEFLPVSVPEGKSVAEGIMSGDWEWAVPEALSGGVSTALEGVEAPGQILSGVPYSPQEMQDAAWKTVGTAAAGSLTAPVPDGATRMFGGMRAKKFPLDRYDAMDAKEFELGMQGKKLDPAIAWEDYGIEVGEEGPVFQIDPAGARTRTPFTVEKKLDQMLKDYKHAAFDMDEVLDFPELFDNYPVLKDFKVTVRSEKNGEPLSRGGWFDAQNGEVVVGPESARNPEEFRQVLLHELQHGIQAVENTSGGASTEHFFRWNKDAGKFETGVQDLADEVRRLNTVKDRVIDAEVNYGKDSETYKESWDEYVDRYRALSKAAWKKYLTNSGEVEARAAELWDQLSPEEKKTTTPSEIKKQALGLLKKEYGDTEMPTARLSNRYAEGGMVQGNNMEQDMTKLFAEGGVNTGEAEVDPVSGNEVPPGSMPEEVRDDVDAKLSGGEYVVPADVLRFYGVAYFERLRKKAKEALAEMDQEGRIGGDKEEAPEMGQEEEDDDLPFGDDELMFEDDGEEMAFAEGGVVPPGGIKTFEPNQYFAGFSAFNGLPAQPQAETRTYVNAQGQRVSIQFINGQPQQPIPAGFYPEGQVPTTAQNTAVAPQAKEESSNRDEQRSKTRQNTEKGLDWGAGKDWSSMSADEAVSLATSRLEGNKVMSGIAQGLGALNPLAGLAAGAAVNLRPFAEANGIEKALRASGNTAAADAVAGLVDTRLSESKIGVRTLEPLLANGTQVAKQLMAGTTAASGPTRSVGTFTKSATPTERGQSKDETRGRDSGSTMKVSADGKSATITKGPGKSAPAPSKPAPKPETKSTPPKSTPSKQPQASRAGFEKGGLVTRRKK